MWLSMGMDGRASTKHFVYARAYACLDPIMDQRTTSPDREQDGPAYGWQRWLFASMLGGILSIWSAYGIAISAIRIIGQPQPGLDIAGLLNGIMVLLVSAVLGGVSGGLCHWLLTKHQWHHAWWLTAKWSLGFVLCMVLASVTGIVNWIEKLATSSGAPGEAAALLTLLGGALGVLIAGAVGDTRPAV